MREAVMARWPRVLDAAFGPPLPGNYRARPEDFRVEETLDFVPEGHGEHLWLRLEKRNQTTLDVVRILARLCAVGPRDVGYSGMKDRVAVTRQWLSVHLPGKDDPEALESQLAELGIILLEQVRHPRKLKRGVHRTNRFTLCLTGEAVAAPDFTRRWETLCETGVPNYFGPQRFGAGGRNLLRARELLARGWRKSDDRQGMMLSTARSFLFNELLGARVQAGDWAQPVAGDVVMLDGTQSIFCVDEVPTELLERAAALDIHPTGPMWGTGELATQQAGSYEQQLSQTHDALCEGLCQAGVKRAQRALRMRLLEPSLQIEGDRVQLAFSLPRGGFATAVLAELIEHPDFAGFSIDHARPDG
ncbi:tRNA pseudouridine(13) synthase TruD [Halomonas sp. ZH2S]|uniref:tRNA pseudouridine synthase D n=1 Tax=Vreelandella zhuhanensis TaxID=2684210 RepID=A0A7X3H2X4_9GAMM|nr:tRNA pseudouridine(13) synthase TruD [Halomonas zhuhanensis]MWJ29244.1 tRNA pseudouridine(13) synthase TruD [Halomonas zhuhanensis]